jgi:putative hydrolase of the HAD superfamily
MEEGRLGGDRGQVGVRRAICFDIGGVLLADYLRPAAAQWGERLGCGERSFLEALFAGSDDQVLTGRQDEASWWRVVAGRLRVSEDLTAELRRDLAARQRWDPDLVALVRALRGRVATALVSNAWPQMRDGLAAAGLTGAVDAVILSCEVGYAKPDARIYRAALGRLGARPVDALFVDDTPGHVAAAQALGLAGHVHTDAASTIVLVAEFARGA